MFKSKKRLISNAFSKKNRALLSELVRTDFKLRYQGSVLGYVWSLFRPLMLFGILYTVFTKILPLGKGIPNYAISLLLGIVLWNFFVEATTSSLQSIVGRASLIRKIKMPTYLIPVSTVLSALINLTFNMIVVFIFLAFSPINAISWRTVVFLPLLIAELTVVAVALALLLSAAYTRFRDIDHIWDIIKQAFFYTIPIIYPLSRVHSEKLQKLIMFNPLSQIIQDARRIITYEGTARATDLYRSLTFKILVELFPIIIIGITLLVGVIYFKKESKNFSENV